MSRAGYKRLGDYIRQVDVRNRDLSVDVLLGVSVNKYFIPSIANTIGTDMSSYKIVCSGQFVYIPDTSRRGDKIAIALLDKWNKALVSAIYTVFEIVDEGKLLPEYLMMWFRRPEFDRYARFKSHGSAREVFEWEEMCDVMLPVPPIERQRQIVAEYQAIERRIENNRHLIAALEDTARTIYRKMFVDDIDPENLPEGWRMGTLGEIAEFKNGKAVQLTEGVFPVYGGNGIVGSHDSYNAMNIIVIGRVGVNCGNIQLERNKCWVNDNAIMAVSKNGVLHYLYWLLDTLGLNSKSEGSGQPLLTQSNLNQVYCIVPYRDAMRQFDKMAGIIGMEIHHKMEEVKKLTGLQPLLLAKIVSQNKKQ